MEIKEALVTNPAEGVDTKEASVKIVTEEEESKETDPTPFNL